MVTILSLFDWVALLVSLPKKSLNLKIMDSGKHSRMVEREILRDNKQLILIESDFVLRIVNGSLDSQEFILYS